MANKVTILHIDNHTEFRESTRWFLEQANYEVIGAGTPEEGRSILESGTVALAIVDMRLLNDRDGKDFSGLELAKEVKTDIPKIMYTNFPSYEAAREALGPRIEGLPPAVDFIAKVEGPEVLITAVRKALDMVKKRSELLVTPTSGAASTPEEKTGLRLDKDQRILKANNQPVNLTPLEYSLMEYFFDHLNRVISHEEIVREVLKDAHAGYAYKNRINNMIHRLRDKIQADKSSPQYLYTIRGHGFKLSL
jgi:DNA-binding response OmpR family regulator